MQEVRDSDGVLFVSATVASGSDGACKVYLKCNNPWCRPPQSRQRPFDGHLFTVCLSLKQLKQVLVGFINEYLSEGDACTNFGHFMTLWASSVQSGHLFTGFDVTINDALLWPLGPPKLNDFRRATPVGSGQQSNTLQCVSIKVSRSSRVGNSIFWNRHSASKAFLVFTSSLSNRMLNHRKSSKLSTIFNVLWSYRELSEVALQIPLLALGWTCEKIESQFAFIVVPVC